jgi:hypothetical protein
MSLIGNTALNEVVKEKHFSDPGEILYHLSKNMVTALRQGHKATEETGSYSMRGVKDGMDMALCAIDEENGVMKFAGANNPLYYVQDGVIKELKGDRQPVGIFEGEIKSFTVHTIPLK